MNFINLYVISATGSILYKSKLKNLYLNKKTKKRQCFVYSNIIFKVMVSFLFLSHRIDYYSSLFVLLKPSVMLQFLQKYRKNQKELTVIKFITLTPG